MGFPCLKKGQKMYKPKFKFSPGIAQLTPVLLIPSFLIPSRAPLALNVRCTTSGRFATKVFSELAPRVPKVTLPFIPSSSCLMMRPLAPGWVRCSSAVSLTVYKERALAIAWRTGNSQDTSSHCSTAVREALPLHRARKRASYTSGWRP